MATALKQLQEKTIQTKVYCTLCTRTVEARVGLSTSVGGRRRLVVSPGQKCPRCEAPLDAAFVLNKLPFVAAVWSSQTRLSQQFSAPVRRSLTSAATRLEPDRGDPSLSRNLLRGKSLGRVNK